MRTAITPRMLFVLRDLAQHPGGLSTPELAERHDAGGLPRQKALTRCGNMMRSLEHHNLVRRAGTVRGSCQRGPAVIWQVTDEGRAFAAEPAPAEAKAQAAQERIAQRERALAVLDGLRQAGYGPRTPYDLQVLWCPALRAVGCTNRQMAALFGITHQGISRRITTRPVAVQQRDISLGAAGSVSVTVNIRSLAGLPGEKLTQVRELINDIEALGDSGPTGAPDLLGEAERARHIAGFGESGRRR
jgi:hypothetical protein